MDLVCTNTIHLLNSLTMETPNINNFETAPVVRDYVLSPNTHSKLEIDLSNILEKKEEGTKLSATELELDFQFQKFFTWKQDINYEIVVNLSGSFCTSHSMYIEKDLFDEIEEGDTDYDHSELCVDPYDLDDPSEGVSIDESEVGEKRISISVWDLKIKDEFETNFINVPELEEGGAA